MNKVIFKYQIQPTTPILLHLPKNAEILFVETQQETMCIWCLVNKNARLEPRWFHLYETGGTNSTRYSYYKRNLYWYI